MYFARANLSVRYCNFRCVFALTTCVVKNQAKYLWTRGMLFQAGNSQKKISRDLSISRTTIQSIIYKFQQTNSVENKGHRGRKSKWTIRDTNLLFLPVNRQKRMKFCKEKISWSIEQWKM